MNDYYLNVIKPFFKVNNKQEKWINVCKTLAILAMLIDHFQFNNSVISYLSYFSVELFIFISGVNTYKGNYNYSKVIKKIISLLFEYVVACTLCYLILYNKLIIKDLINNIICFCTTPSHYFVFMYIQLMIISPLLIKLINNSNSKQKALLLIAIIIFSAMSNNYRLFPIHGSGGC